MSSAELQRHLQFLVDLPEPIQALIQETQNHTFQSTLYLVVRSPEHEMELFGALYIAHDVLAEHGYTGVFLVGSPIGLVSVGALRHAYQLQWEETIKGFPCC